jgi:LemA protein
MTGDSLLALLLGALLVFWMVGAYNRLVALRNGIGTAWAQADEQLRRRRDALPLLVAALREPLEAEQSTLDAVLAALSQSQAAADVLRARPVQAGAAASFVAAEGVLASALTRLLALLDQHPEIRQREDVGGWLRELHDADLRYAFARQLFNDAVAAYNAAARQQPTRLLALIYGFGAAGPLGG